MLRKNAGVDGEQSVLVGETQGKHTEMSLENTIEMQVKNLDIIYSKSHVV